MDLNLVTSILYPGQTRGGNYKPHGGFGLDRPGQSNNVTVVAPLDGMVYRGARYTENGSQQILIDVLNACGIMYRFDHVLTLSARFQQTAEAWPLSSDSRTTMTAPGQTVTAGETIATAVGQSGNVFFDWGVYDLRRRNGSAAPEGELSSYAVCWFDWLSASDAARVRSLPSRDGASGSTSDYCR